MTTAHGKPVIGLLGGPGAGKSLVAGEFARQGAGLIDADALSRAVMETPEVREQLRQWWGESVLTDAGEVDRAAVGRRVFNDEAALTALEGLIHPRVRQRRASLREQFAADPAVVAIVEDSPLLLESGLDAECDALVFVEAARAVRARRLAARRGWSSEELARRESRQWPLDTKRARADYVISNDGEEEACVKAARRVFSRLRRVRVS